MKVRGTTDSTNRIICMAINKLSFVMARISDQLLRQELLLTHAQFRMLMAIRHHGQISQKKVANFHGLSEAAISRQISPLLKKRFIATTVNAENRREHLLVLTDRGSQLAERALRLLDRRFDKLIDSIGAEQKKKLAELLGVLLDVVCQSDDTICKVRR
ncbi:MAG: MarR family transcriptional regulator [Patescibacteria group bacterium]